jgi:hypothetical protein
MNKELYLDDYSMEDILSNSDIEETIDIEKPSFSMKSNYNSKGEKIVVFSINIPLKKNEFKIDILINNEMYKNIGKHFKL